MSKIAISLMFLVLAPLANADVLCASQIESQAKAKAEAELGGTCTANNLQSESQDRSVINPFEKGSVVGFCKGTVGSGKSVLVRPFNYSYSVNMLVFDRYASCDHAVEVTNPED